MAQAIQATAQTAFEPARRRTMYFIGVTTAKSSIMRVFPRWAEYLNLGDVEIKGIDCKWHDQREVYRRVVEFIAGDPLSMGALVTTHKIDLLTACRDMFHFLDPYAELMGEVSSISKRHGKLRGHAKDPITSGLALEAFVPPGHWAGTGGETLVLGAGGSSIALTSYMMDRRHGANMPSRLIVTNRSDARLAEIKHIHDKIGRPIPVDYHLTPRAEDNDMLMSRLRPHSLVVNATGLGKDAPGSPLTSAGIFPLQGLAWDFNYRGDLLFLDQARAQKGSRKLFIEDGWVYFLHGWTRVIAEVFDIDIPTSGPGFEAMSKLAREAR